MSKPANYFTFIDGLRAIAVIVVIIFHYNKNWVPSGHLGVDLFFVISGFLITSIIHPKIESQNFDLKEFWKKRIKRILPLSTFVGFVTLILIVTIYFKGRIYLSSLDGFFAISSFANFWFLYEYNDGYWGTGVSESPFLHYWSLSVEEQFYAFYPIFLILILKLKHHRRFFYLVFLLSLSSYITAIFLGKLNLTFYFTPLRIWQLMAGGLIYLHRDLHSSLPSLRKIGLPCLILTIPFFFLPDLNDTFRTLSAIPFTLLVSFLILSYSSSISRSVLLESKLAQVVGKLSFSLYLWHWPILLLFKNQKEGEIFDFFLYIGVTLIASTLSYFFIEKTFRYNSTKHRYILISSSALVGLAALSALLAPKFNAYGAAPHIIFNDFKYDISPQMFETITQGRESLSINVSRETKPLKNLTLFNKSGGLSITQFPDSPKILIIGDSHSLMWCDILAEISNRREWQLDSICASGLKAYFSIPFSKSKLPHHRKFTQSQMLACCLNKIETIKTGQYDLIIIANRFTNREEQFSDSESFIEFCSTYSSVLLIEQPPIIDTSNNNASQYAVFLGNQKAQSYFVKLAKDKDWLIGNSHLKKISENNNKIFTFPLNIAPLQGLVKVIENDRCFYFDDDHLSYSGTKLHSQSLEKQISQLLAGVDLEDNQ